MSELYVTKINTDKGSLQIDYNALAHKPESDKTLSTEGKFADAKVTGNKITLLENSVSSFEGQVSEFSSTIETFTGKIDNIFEQAEDENKHVVTTMKSDMSMGGNKITNLVVDEEPEAEDAVNKQYVDDMFGTIFEQKEVGEDKDKKVVTTIKSEISMAVGETKNKITNLADPEDDADAATKKYVDDAVGGIFKQEDGDDSSSVTIIQTTIQMAKDTKITGLEAPTEDTDAANKKYVDDKHVLFHPYLKLLKDTWKGPVAPFTYEYELEGILESDTPHWGIVYSGNMENKLNQKRCFAYIDDLDTSDGKLTFTCFKNKPGIDLTIQIEVNR